METTILSHLLMETARMLAPACGEVARYEAEQIVGHVLHCSRSEIYLRAYMPVSPEQRTAVERLVARRRTGEPLGYVLGTVYFFNTDIVVNPAVLIPRPETETLVETVLARETGMRIHFLDLGTGSGAIAAALLHERPLWKAAASDISINALRMAGSAITGNRLLVCADGFTALKHAPAFDFIVSNPPYVAADEWDGLDPSVRRFEPRISLYGGDDGLDFYRLISSQAGRYLKSGGRIYCELSSSRWKGAEALFRDSGWGDVSIRNDLSGRPRVLCAVTRTGNSRDETSGR